MTNNSDISYDIMPDRVIRCSDFEKIIKQENFTMSIIQIIFNAISPDLRKLLVDFINTLSIKAAKTDNPLDDIVVNLIKQLFAIKD